MQGYDGTYNGDSGRDKDQSSSTERSLAQLAESGGGGEPSRQEYSTSSSSSGGYSSSGSSDGMSFSAIGYIVLFVCAFILQFALTQKDQTDPTRYPNWYVLMNCGSMAVGIIAFFAAALFLEGLREELGDYEFDFSSFSGVSDMVLGACGLLILLIIPPAVVFFDGIGIFQRVFIGVPRFVSGMMSPALIETDSIIVFWLFAGPIFAMIILLFIGLLSWILYIGVKILRH